MSFQQELLHYLSAYIPITDELRVAVIEAGHFQQFTKKTILLRAGDKCNECYFILKGCVRSFYLIDGEEKTTNFFTEGEVVSPASYGTDLPSEFFLECVEDTIAGVGTPESEKDMYNKYPILESMSRIVGEKILAEYQNAFDIFKLSSPEERYIYLVENKPDLVQRVPQHQLASYIGIKPESLSRIRKRTVRRK